MPPNTRPFGDMYGLFISADDAEVLITRSGALIPNVPTLWNIMKKPSRWGVLLSVYGYDKAGNQVIDTAFAKARKLMTRKDMHPHILQASRELIRDFAGDEIVGFSWIAQPDGIDHWGDDGRKALDVLLQHDAFVTGNKGS